MRSLYTYDGQRPEDLSFDENLVIVANPAKDPESPWWFGRIQSSGKSGWLPKSYVEELTGASHLLPLLNSADDVPTCSSKGKGALHVRRNLGRRALVRRGRHPLHRRELRPLVVEGRARWPDCPRPRDVPRTESVISPKLAASPPFSSLGLVNSRTETLSQPCPSPLVRNTTHVILPTPSAL